MTEQEWLASKDPQAMFRWAKSPNVDTANKAAQCEANRRLSDRKLRLFAAACVWNVADAARSCSNVDQFIRNTEAWAETGQAPPGVRESSDPEDIHDLAIDHAMGAASWAHCHRGDRTAAELNAAQAALLRDIAGNPHRLATRHNLYRTGDPDAPAGVKDGNGEVVLGLCRNCGRGEAELSGPCRWLTPTVLSLAQAAYDERVAPCGRCGGSGTLLDIEDFDTDARTEESCDRCHGTGIIDDGTLDPVRLAILADALEEAGCPAEEGAECPDCSPYKDDPDNHWPGKLGYRPVRDVASGRHEGGWGNCYRCNGGGKGHWRPGFVLLPNPLLAHLRSPGPHVRGCWALDLILGKE